MQTFVPYTDFEQIAQCLDYRRLGKQRVEAYQLLQAIARNTGWSNHPAALMWKATPAALRQYMRVMIEEWIARGYNNTMILPRKSTTFKYPDWWGDERVHSSHRAALLHKDPTHYSQFGWTEKPAKNYYWPRSNT